MRYQSSNFVDMNNNNKTAQKSSKRPLEKLKSEKLTLDWRKRLQTRAQVMISIEQILDEELPEIYEEEKIIRVAPSQQID